MKKIALVTGASSGIGLDAALRLLDKGYVVYGAARRVELMTPIIEKGGFAIKLDLTDDESIKSCVEEISKKEGRIDVLVNNAGFGLGGALEDIPLEEAKKQFEVNVFSLIRLTQLVLPMMRRQKSGKIINVASIAGRFSSPYTGWYHATKYSVEALSDALRHEVRRFGIKVVIVEPGIIQTDWGVIHAGNIRKYSENTAYFLGARNVAEYYENFYSRSKSGSKPSVISKLIVKIADKKNPKARYTAGKYAKLFVCLKKILPDAVFDFFERLIMQP